MKKLDNKLFFKFELGKPELNSIVGGAYTSAESDTNAGGGTSDVCQSTCIDGEEVTDTHNTSFNWDTRDKPVLTLAP
jgi:hypothetical protein